MKYTCFGNRHQLIHILRFIATPSGRGVLDRDWEFRGLFGAIFNDVKVSSMADQNLSGEITIFPELNQSLFESSVVTYRINGVRLMERSGLIYELEDALLVRFRNDLTDDIDLKMSFYIGSPVLIETDEKVLHESLCRWFAATSAPEFDACFC